MIPCYKRISKVIFKISFSRSCSPSRATKRKHHAYRHTLVAQNCRASVRLDHCIYIIGIKLTGQVNLKTNYKQFFTYMYIYICDSMFNVCGYMYVFMCTCICMYMYGWIWLCVYVVHVSKYIYIYIHTHIYTYIHVHIHHIHIHTTIYTHTHMHIHIDKNIHSQTHSYFFFV